MKAILSYWLRTQYPRKQPSFFLPNLQHKTKRCCHPQLPCLLSKSKPVLAQKHIRSREGTHPQGFWDWNEALPQFPNWGTMHKRWLISSSADRHKGHLLAKRKPDFFNWSKVRISPTKLPNQRSKLLEEHICFKLKFRRMELLVNHAPSPLYIWSLWLSSKRDCSLWRTSNPTISLVRHCWPM